MNAQAGSFWPHSRYPAVWLLLRRRDFVDRVAADHWSQSKIDGVRGSIPAEEIAEQPLRKRFGHIDCSWLPVG